MPWAPDYVDRATVKSYLQIDSDDDDAFIDLWCSAASRNVDEHCLRQFGQVEAEQRSYRGEYDRRCGRYVFHVDDLPTLDGFAIVDASDSPVTSYDVEPVNALQRGRPIERVVCDTSGTLRMTAPWGWTDTPPSIKVGLLLMAARLAARRGAPFGTAGSPADGSEIRLLAKLDPDMITVLKPYRRWRGAS